MCGARERRWRIDTRPRTVALEGRFPPCNGRCRGLKDCYGGRRGRHGGAARGAAGALLLEFKVGPPVWVHVLLWGLVTPIVAFFLLRVLKGTLIALQYKHKAAEWRFAGDR